MRTVFSTLVRLVPLAAASFLMAADGGACIILQNNTNPGEGEGEGEGETCPDLGELCPSLVCEAGNALDDAGCPICECNPIACSAGPADVAAPECENPVFDQATCRWVCTTSECRTDADCPSGAACIDGICQRTTAGCFSDTDCGLGSFCSFDGTTDPLPPDDNGGGGAPRPGPSGVCQPLPSCFSDADCGFGKRCVPLSSAGALVAVQSICVDATPCTSDRECSNGDICLFGGYDARPCRDSDGDGICDGATEPPPPPQGFCGQPSIVPGCFSDAECGQGAVCRLPSGCECNVCIDDGNGGCLPCDCAGVAGTCEPVGPGDSECRDDSGCARGEKCVTYAVGCERPTCEIGPDGQQVCYPCDPIAVGRCETETVICTSDRDCGPNAFCSLPDVLPPPCDPTRGCDIPPPAPEGVCVPFGIDACSTVRCDIGTICVVDAAGNAGCQADPCLAVRCTDTTHCEAQRDGTAMCVPNDPPVPECASSADCSADGSLVCNAGTDVCLQNPNCAPGDICTRECWGFCVPPPPPPPVANCTSSADCSADGSLVCTTEVDGACLSNPRCVAGEPCTDECWGTCVPPRR